MLIPGHVQVHLALEPVSLLKSIDGLCAEVERRFSVDPMTGHVFVFVNRTHTGVKLLYWDHGGFVLTYKRLERGRFVWPQAQSGTVALSAASDRSERPASTTAVTGGHRAASPSQWT